MSDHAPDPAMLAKAETLTEALPYIQKYVGRTFVVKYGGHAMGDPERAIDFAEDVVLLKAIGINPIVVHGGGPQIGAMLKRLGIQSEFVDGLRVTDAATAEVAEMVLAGAINKDLVSWIGRAGGTAVGISGKDARLVTARKLTRTSRDPDSNIERVVDLGFVGEPVEVNRKILDLMTSSDVIPVIAPIATDADGRPQARLTDFGIGFLADKSRLREPGFTVLGFTETGLATDTPAGGTVRYMAPEQLEGKPATIQGDIYSLGVVLYQIVAGDFGRTLARGWQRVALHVAGRGHRAPVGVGSERELMARAIQQRQPRPCIRQPRAVV